jgi:hypothetical protein
MFEPVLTPHFQFQWKKGLRRSVGWLVFPVDLLCSNSFPVWKFGYLTIAAWFLLSLTRPRHGEKPNSELVEANGPKRPLE